MFVLRYVFVLSHIATVRCQIDGYIVSGDNAIITNFPHSACLGITCSVDHSKIAFLCGASILNQRILLTAAHCLHPCEAKALIEINTGSKFRLRGFNTLAVQYIVHDKYHPETSSHDIALVKTKQRLNFSRNICRLSIMQNPPATTLAKLAGWGLIDEYRGTSTTRLQQLNQTVWSKYKCEKLLGKIPIGSFCAANEDSNRYASSGDSGSALVVKDYIGIGMVSHKRPYYSDHVVVYTNLSYHYEWIRANVKRLYCATQN